MAYQPKSYRKFLAGTVTAAVVASAVAPAASAAFTDVSANDTHAINVNKAVEMGLINGYPDGTFGTYQDITRGQVAKIIARYLGNVDTTGTQQFTDVANSPDTELKAAALKVRAAGVFTGSDGALNAGKNITRQEMASVVARLFELTDIEGVESKVTDNDSAWEVHRANINLLSEYGITTEASFNPLANVKRGQFASFIVRAIELAQEVKIEKVSALDASGKFVEISFSKPVIGLEASDIQITDAKTGARKGVKEVKLSSNGKLATVELFAPEDAASGEVLNYLTDYTVKVYVNGETLTATFNRPAFTEARVIDINVADKEIVVANVDSGAERTLEVVDGEFDYQAAIGEVGSFWYNKDNEIVKFVAAESTAKYDAIEITKADEIKLVSEDKKYDVSEEEYTNGSSKVKFFLNGEEVEIGDEDFEIGDKFNFAKVGFDKSGDIEYVSAYNFKEFIVVKEVKGDEVVGFEGNGTGGAFDAEDATIIKDGKVISLEDIKQGDVLFFNEDADDKDGFAEVLSNTVSGEIETVYDDAVKVDGEVYEFIYDQAELSKFDVDYATGAVYVDEDGETAVVDSDAAEELQAAGEVTLYFDRAGNLVYIGGDLAEVESNTKTSILTSNIVGYTQARDRVEIEALTEDGEEELFDINLKDLDTITIDGFDYDIDNEDTTASNDKYAVKLNGQVLEIYTHVNTSGVVQGSVVNSINLAATKGQAVELKLDDNGNLEEIEFFKAANTTKEGSDTLDAGEVLEPGDSYFEAVSGAKRLNSNTVVFDISDDVSGFDADDVEISTWGEYDGADINGATAIYDEDNEVIALVITGTTTADKVFEEAVVTNVLRDTDKKIVEVRAWVNGEEKTFKVDKVSNTTLDKGHVAVFEFSKSNLELVKDVVTNTEYTSRVKTGLEVKEVNVGTGEVTFVGGAKYKLVDNGEVLNVADKNDIEDKTLSDLRGKKNVTVVLDEKTGTFAKFFVYGAQAGTAPEVKSQGTLLAPITTGSAGTVTLNVDGETKSYNFTNSLVLFDASGTVVTAPETLPIGTKVNYTFVEGTQTLATITAVELDRTAPKAVTDLKFNDTDSTQGEVGGEVTFTASTSTDVDSTVVTFNGATVTKNAATGVYTIADNTAIGAGELKVVVADKEGNTATTTLVVTDFVSLQPALSAKPELKLADGTAPTVTQDPADAKAYTVDLSQADASDTFSTLAFTAADNAAPEEITVKFGNFTRTVDVTNNNGVVTVDLTAIPGFAGLTVQDLRDLSADGFATINVDLKNGEGVTSYKVNLDLN